MKKSLLSTFGSMALVLAMIGCSGQNFVVIEDAPHGFASNQTLGMRTATDLGAVAPTTKMAWLEVCDKQVKKTGAFSDRGASQYEQVSYVNCQPADHLQQIADKSTTTGYIAGVAAPVIQGAAIAYAGHEIGKGIGNSGSRTTNNNGNSSGNSAVNSNSNGNSNSANGGQGGNGHGGNGGNGGHGGSGGPGNSDGVPGGGNTNNGNNGNH